MEVIVECHGIAGRRAGAPEHAVALAPGARVHELLDALAARWPELGRVLPACACAVGDRLVPRTHALAGGERLALLPPVSGG